MSASIGELYHVHFFPVTKLVRLVGKIEWHSRFEDVASINMNENSVLRQNHTTCFFCLSLFLPLLLTNLNKSTDFNPAETSRTNNNSYFVCTHARTELYIKHLFIYRWELQMKTAVSHMEFDVIIVAFNW